MSGIFYTDKFTPTQLVLWKYFTCYRKNLDKRTLFYVLRDMADLDLSLGNYTEDFIDTLDYQAQMIPPVSYLQASGATYKIQIKPENRNFCVDGLYKSTLYMPASNYLRQIIGPEDGYYWIDEERYEKLN